jgi:hypothetical protein
MGQVEVVGSVTIGGRAMKLRRSPLIFKRMGELFVEATTVQMRVLTHATKDYIIDKLLAGDTFGRKARVERAVAQPKDAPDEAPLQDLKEEEPDIFKNLVKIPARTSDPAGVTRIPFTMDKLSASWQTRKEKKGLDPRLLIASGDYLRGIVVRRKVDPDRKNVSYMVTLAKRSHRGTNLSLQRLAEIHEFGTSSYTVPFFGDKKHLVQIQIPARPHWRPAYQQMVEQAKKIGSDATARMLRTALQQLA